MRFFMRRSVIILAATVVVALACRNPGEPSARSTPIVYVRNQTNRMGEDELYLTNEDGSVKRPLVTQLGYKLRPTWSPDGRRVAFSDESHIFIVNADGSGLKQLTSGTGQRSGPAWSRDGSRLAFVNAGGLAVIDTDGANFRLLPNTEGTYTGGPSWSPDGYLVFARVFPKNGIWRVRADGTDLKQLTSGVCNELNPRWSPDGLRLAIQTSCGLVIADASGLNRRQLTTSSVDASPSWAPDGRRIVFHRSGTTFLELRIVNLEDGSTTQVARTGPIEWQPDWNQVP